MDVDKNIRFSLGLAISLTVILLPMFTWFIGYNFSFMTGAEAAAVSLSKFSAFGGMAMFAWSLILSGRYKIFDSLFGGLDKVYVAHRFFGTASIALLLLHPLGYTFEYLLQPGVKDLFGHFFAYKNLGFTLGRVALYGLILLGVWSILTKVKHETFVTVHRWLGVLFTLGAIHAFMAGQSSVLAQNSFVFWYMLVLSVIAIATFLHYSLLADFLHPYFRYKVSHIQKVADDVWSLRLKPKYRMLNFKPGQFLYVSFDTLPEHGFHPFTVASGQRSSEIQFYIKELGDLTEKFQKLRTGDRVKVKGPYGGFTFDDTRFKNQLWIGAGIGITPFLSKARSLQYSKKNQRIELIYAVNQKSEAWAAKELDDIEYKAGSFNYTLVNVAEFGMQSLHDLAEHFGGLEDYAIYLCGPPPMLKAYSQQIKELDLEDHLHFEEFSF